MVFQKNDATLVSAKHADGAVHAQLARAETTVNGFELFLMVAKVLRAIHLTNFSARSPLASSHTGTVCSSDIGSYLLSALQVRLYSIAHVFWYP